MNTKSSLNFQQLSRPALEDIEEKMKSQTITYMWTCEKYAKRYVICGYNSISIKEEVDMRYA